MRVLSLKERFDLLESDLLSQPPRISIYADLPFAMLLYEPQKQWEARRAMRLLAQRLKKDERNIEFISLGELLWQIIADAEGTQALIEMEKQWGFEAAQEQVALYLSDPDFGPTLSQVLSQRLETLDPRRDFAFLWRAETLAPALAHTSTLLDQMQGKTKVTTVLFYPGTVDGAELCFMGLAHRHSSRNYRVKLYA